MRCIYCLDGKTKVLYTEKGIENIVRRRECLVCKRRFYTEEVVVDDKTGSKLAYQIHLENKNNNEE